jgi:hypothetical protein
MGRLKSIVMFFILFSMLNASQNPEDIAKRLGLSAGSKAIVQWERVFKSKRKMKRYKIDTLSKIEQEALKNYLIDHAIDSDHPTVAGG